MYINEKRDGPYSGFGYLYSLVFDNMEPKGITVILQF